MPNFTPPLELAGALWMCSPVISSDVSTVNAPPKSKFMTVTSYVNSVWSALNSNRAVPELAVETDGTSWAPVMGTLNMVAANAVPQTSVEKKKVTKVTRRS